MNHFYLGCDVSKGYADFIILDSKKSIIESPFQLDDTFDGHCCLYELLNRFFKMHPNTILYAAVESTGGLENNWLNLFYKLVEIFNIKAARINPSAIKALYDASLTRNINDGISAQTIAEYLITYPEKVSYNTYDPYATLRKQWNYIEMLKKQRTQLLNQLSVHMYTALPFLVKYCNNSVPNWLLKLLLYYPSAKKLAKSNESSLCKIPYISHKRALNIISDAQNSVGSANDQVTVFLIKSLVKQILNLKKTVEAQENYMIEHCNLPEVELLMSFRGIGIISAIGLVLNIISVSRFPTAKHLASYFGVHPIYKQSGDGSWGFHMSKKGRSTPRAILFLIAWSGINSNPLIKEVYIDHIKRGKSKMAALGVCMHKILRIVYGMLKSNKPFDPQIDKRNKNKTRQQADKNESEKEDIKRRFQVRDKDAPISRRQSVKRKKRKESQSLS